MNDKIYLQEMIDSEIGKNAIYEIFTETRSEGINYSIDNMKLLIKINQYYQAAFLAKFMRDTNKAVIQKKAA